jgi:hypothetical protein
MSKKMKKLLGKIFVYLLGIAFIVIGVLFYLDYSGTNIENPVKAKGKIMRILESKNTNTMFAAYEYSSFRPVIVFNTENGETVQFVELYAKGEKDDYQINSVVDIIYNKSNPEEAKLKHSNPIWGEHLILIGLGLLIIFLRMIV